MAENPNEYDDEAYLRYASELDDAIYSLWDAGAEAHEILALAKHAVEGIA